MYSRIREGCAREGNAELRGNSKDEWFYVSNIWSFEVKFVNLQYEDT